jgi:hypothetical protein
VDSADNSWSGERVEFCEHPPSIAMQAFIQRKKSFVDFQKALPFGTCLAGWKRKELLTPPSRKDISCLLEAFSSKLG